MNYPLISEYIEAVRYSEDNFDKLKNLRPVLDHNGNPVMSSGNFSVVFKMKDETTEKCYAIKCFTREQEERDERYKAIVEELKNVNSKYFVSVNYIEKELFVNTLQSDEKEFPVVLMDWVEGITLDEYINNNINNSYELNLLSYYFCRLGKWLLSQPFAHGDLKPANIIVREDKSLVIVDYDGMFVPSLKGKNALEIGSPDYQHPMRSIQTYNRNIDDFSISVIALSLKAIALNASLYSPKTNGLSMSAIDYTNISESEIFTSMLTLVGKSKEISSLLSLFIMSLSQAELHPLYDNLLSMKEPLRSNVTEEDMKNSYIDDFGVRFSNDNKRLIKFPEETKISHYTIPNHVEVICDYAFAKCTRYAFLDSEYPKTIDFPNSLKMIGFGAFGGAAIRSVVIPNNTLYIGSYAFTGSNLIEIQLPSLCNYIGEYAFCHCANLLNVKLPTNIDTIDKGLFAGCELMKKIIIPDNVKTINESAFEGCLCLECVTMSKNIKSIDKDAFHNCAKQSAYNTYSYKGYLDRQVFSNWDLYQESDHLTVNIDIGKEEIFVNFAKNVNIPRFVFLYKF